MRVVLRALVTICYEALRRLALKKPYENAIGIRSKFHLALCGLYVRSTIFSIFIYESKPIRALARDMGACPSHGQSLGPCSPWDAPGPALLPQEWQRPRLAHGATCNHKWNSSTGSTTYMGGRSGHKKDSVYFPFKAPIIFHI